MMMKPHHVGICVKDLKRSLDFWCEGLGFEHMGELEVGSEWSDALEVGGEVDFDSHLITKDGYTFELLHFRTPQPHGEPSGRRDRLGLTHLALDVEDLPACLDRLVHHGGKVLESTRTASPTPDGIVELVFVRDPDGVRVELICHTVSSGVSE
jgi:lactoylglutathione lyase